MKGKSFFMKMIVRDKMEITCFEFDGRMEDIMMLNWFVSNWLNMQGSQSEYEEKYTELNLLGRGNYGI